MNIENLPPPPGKQFQESRKLVTGPRRGTKLRKMHRKLDETFENAGFRFSRVCKGCITFGVYMRRGDPHVEMDAKTFEGLKDRGLVQESKVHPGCFFLNDIGA